MDRIKLFRQRLLLRASIIELEQELEEYERKRDDLLLTQNKAENEINKEEKKKLNQNNFVYFVKCGNWVKIGKSGDVNQRMQQLQTSNPDPLILLWFSDKFEEKTIHLIFESLRIQGEWFRFDQPIRDFLKTHEEYNLLNQPPRGETNEPFRIHGNENR